MGCGWVRAHGGGKYQELRTFQGKGVGGGREKEERVYARTQPVKGIGVDEYNATVVAYLQQSPQPQGPGATGSRSGTYLQVSPQPEPGAKGRKSQRQSGSRSEAHRVSC